MFKESYGESNLNILVLIDSVPNDNGKVTVQDKDGDYSQTKTFKTLSIENTTQCKMQNLGYIDSSVV